MSQESVVLVLTEDADMAKLLTIALSRMAHVRPVVSSNADDALDRLRALSPAVVILDLGHRVSPDPVCCYERSFATIQRFKNHPVGSDIPLIGTCYRCEPHDLSHAGLAAVIGKPFVMEDFFAIVSAYLPVH